MRSQGYTVVDCDKLGHKVYISFVFIKDELCSFIDYEPNTKGFKQVVDTFGTEIVNEDGTINRRKLGSIVFSDKGMDSNF